MISGPPASWHRASKRPGLRIIKRRGLVDLSKPMEFQSHPAHVARKNTTINILSTADGTTTGRQQSKKCSQLLAVILGFSTRTSNASKGETDIACPLIYVPKRPAASATTPSGKTLLPEDKHQTTPGC